MNVLVLGCLTDATGNAVTTRRIAAHLGTEHRVTLVDVNELTGLGDLRDLLIREEIEFAVGVHALLSGPYLRSLGVPYALVFGGTDLYEDVYELQQRQMALAVAAASVCVVFSHQNGARAQQLWPSVRGKLRCIPQAVEVSGAADFDLRGSLGLSSSDVVLLLPTGLRRVKDPTFVLEALAEWHAENPSVHLVVCGAELEPDVAPLMRAAISATKGARFLGALPRASLLSAIAQADAVLNTSLSEGMCGVLLEAMALGTPVIARRNAGNRSLVVEGITGLLFDTPSELRALATSLFGAPAQAALMSERARLRVDSEHAPARERSAYLKLAAEYASTRFTSRAVAR